MPAGLAPAASGPPSAVKICAFPAYPLAVAQTQLMRVSLRNTFIQYHLLSIFCCKPCWILRLQRWRGPPSKNTVGLWTSKGSSLQGHSRFVDPSLCYKVSIQVAACSLTSHLQTLILPTILNQPDFLWLHLSPSDMPSMLSVSYEKIAP